MYVKEYDESRYVKRLHTRDGVLLSDQSGIHWTPYFKSGTKVENFKTKIANGQDATGTYVLDFYTPNEVAGTRTLQYHRKTNPAEVQNELFEGLIAPAEEFDHLLQYSEEESAQAVSKLYKKLSNRKTAFQGIAFFGELRQTVDMLRNPLLSMRKVLKRHLDFLKREKERLLKKKLKRDKLYAEYQSAVASSYLEYVFGMLPLISDVKGILSLIKRIVNRKPLSKKLVSRKSFSLVSESRIGSNWVTASDPNAFMQYGGIKTQTSTELRVQHTVGFSVTGSLSQSDLERAIELSGFNLEAFFPSIYEIVPWSWLIDYFTNLGDLVAAYTYDSSDVLWLNRSITIRSLRVRTTEPQSQQTERVSIDVNGLWVYDSSGGDFGTSTMLRTTVSRKPLAKLPVPPFQFEHPSGLSKKWLNIAAVILQRKQFQDLSWLARRGG